MEGISRRRFIRGLGAAGLCALGGGALWAGWRWPGEEAAGGGPALPANAREALYYSGAAEGGGLDCAACHAPAEPSRTLYCHVPHQGRYVRCELCPHRCLLAEGQRGTCRVRENRAGRLYTLAYANPCAVHIDPIEKKPFYHFLPGTTALSLATAGCPLRCQYCQNYTISQRAPEETENYDLPPAHIVAAAVEQRSASIAYTYSEPTAFYEYMLDTARLGRAAGLRSAVISSGYINDAPLRELCRSVEAIKIDLKGLNEDFYREVCAGTLQPVLDAIRTIHEAGVHLEVVNLVVPTLNDDADELRALAEWLRDTVGPDVPLHYTRFHPDYQLLNLPPTPVESLAAARQVALDAGLHYVYVGNVPGHEGNHTYCPQCGQVVVRRSGMATEALSIVDGRCAFCRAPIAGVWS